MTFRAMAIAALMIPLAGTAAASTVSIGFEDASPGFGDETFVEDGFTVAATGGSFFQDQDGTDGGMEYERGFATSGLLNFSNGGLFTFVSLDWQREYGFDSPTANVTVNGYLDGALVATDVFGSSSSNYATFSAVNLAGMNIDLLSIEAERSFSAGGALDAVVLGEEILVAPVPAAGLLLLAGLGGLAAARRKS